MSHVWIQVSALAALLPMLMIAGDRRPLGEVDFFGYGGVDPVAIRSALPFHEGDLFPPARAKSSEGLRQEVSEAVKRVIGQPPTEVSFVCCDSKQNWMVYIGLPGKSYEPLAPNPAPTGDVRLPRAALALRNKFENAWVRAVMKGHATEEDSEGYTLTNEPGARRAELAIREYALHNEPLIFEVLRSSADARHRAVAAQMVGYGRRSEEQVNALVRASLDSDGGVRNDAIRALEVLAGARPEIAAQIPPEPFVRLLRSGAWADHNKGSLVLLALTKSRDARVLASLRAEALDSLTEMARWRSAGHAEAALTILGRIAGIDENSLNRMIEAGQAEAIIGQASR